MSQQIIFHYKMKQQYKLNAKLKKKNKKERNFHNLPENFAFEKLPLGHILKKF